jgi:pimeloyl-ACP methyl ester carboxylesterase
MDSGRVRVGEVELALLEEGSGGRPLLLVHGYGGAKEDFADYLKPLADAGWHVVAPDHRGHGQSDHPPGEGSYTLPTLTGDMVGLVDTLGWDTFVILGHSMGGMIAQMLALDAPDRVEALILMDTGHGPFRAVDRSAIEAGAAIVRDDGLVTYMDVLEKVSDPLGNPAHDRVCASRPGYQEWCDQKLLSCSPEMYASVMLQLPDIPDRLDRFGELTMPSLVIVGELDKPFIGSSRRMYEALPDARFALIPDAGHSPQFEGAEEWWRALSEFLAEVADRDSVADG